MTMLIKIADLAKQGLQTRCALDERTVAEYAENYADGVEFPPVVVFSPVRPTRGKPKYWLADGFHRVEAQLRNGEEKVWCEVKNGGFVDALRYALGANNAHGLPTTNADKRKRLEMAWENRAALFGAEPSAAVLAAACGVHRNTAQAFIGDIQQTFCVQGVLHDEDEAPSPAQIVQVPPAPRRVMGTDGRVQSVPVRPVKMTFNHLKLNEGEDGSPHAVPCDRYGVEIPVPINGAFNGSSLLPDILSAISHARVALRKAIDDGAPWVQAVRQDALVQLNNAYSFVDAAEPWCVCRMCQGNGCKACHGRGWQTEEEYERNPTEFKAQEART